MKNHDPGRGCIDRRDILVPPSTTKIKALVIDIDGVLTDGGIYISGSGEEILAFNVQDGLAIKLAIDAGLLVIFLSGRRSKAAGLRARSLKVSEVHLGIKDKLKRLRQVLAKYKIEPEEVAYIGDDLTDYEAMLWVGYPIAVKNAVAEIKSIAKYVTSAEGGKGAVREVVEHILGKRKHK